MTTPPIRLTSRSNVNKTLAEARGAREDGAPMDTNADIAALREEVAALRQEIEWWRVRWKGIRKFVHFSPEDEGKPAFLSIRCHTLKIEAKDPADDVVAQFSANEHGAQLELWASGDRGALKLGIDENGAGLVTVEDGAGRERVRLGVLPDRDAYAVVFRQDGQPGAVLKGMAETASVAVTGADGKPRVYLHANADGTGEVAVARTGTAQLAKMSAQAEGGLFTATQEGVPGAAGLGMMPGGAGLSLSSGPEGPMFAAMLQGKGAMLRVDAARTSGPSIAMFVDPKQTSCRAKLADGSKSWELSGGPEGQSFELGIREGKAAVSLFAAKTGGSIAVAAEDGSEVARLMAVEGGAVFTLHPAGAQASEQGVGFHVKTKETLIFVGHGSKQLVQLHAGENGAMVNLHSGHEETPFVQLSSGKGGQFVAVRTADEAVLAGMQGTAAGGSLSLHNDLGILRARLAVADDGGLLHLNWGGTVAVSALATPQGGGVVVFDPEGRQLDSLPDAGDDDDDDDEEEDEDER